MDLTQIHHVPNWDTQDENEWIKVTHHIGVSSPYHLKDEKGALSGVDCTVRVIQHLLRSFNRDLSQRLIRDHRRHNFLVDLAVRNFERDTLIQRENMQVARDITWRALCGQKLSANGTPSFAEIDQSDLMQGTLWLEPDFQAFHESFVKPRAGESFQTVGTLNEYPSDLNTLRTSRSLFVWDTSLHQSLEDMFKKHFYRTVLDGAHGTYTLFSKAPKVARVLFDPTKSKLEGLSIFHLYRMSMATRGESHRRRSGGEDEWNVAYTAEDRVSTYSLVAVVRLRNSQDKHDYVRLYDRYGHPVVPAGPARECISYHSDSWSVSDQDHKYMLYYVLISDQAPPQRSGPPSSDMERLTPGPPPMTAPPLSESSSEVVRRGKPPPPPGQMSTHGLFDSWAAGRRMSLKRRLEEKKQAEQ